MRTLLVVLGLAAATPAHAEQVGVVVTGEATLQPQLAAQLEGWLHKRGRTVVPAPLEPTAINTLIDCFVLEDLGCARGVVDARSKAMSVIYARIDVRPLDDGTREVAVIGYWLQKNHDAMGERRVCEHCTDESLRNTVDDLMLSLVHDPPLPAPNAAAATVAAVEPASASEPAAPEELVSESKNRYVPLGLMAAGGVGLVAGGVLIAIDQDPSPSGPQQPTYRDTATAGVVVGLAGAAAVGAGVYLWLRDRSHASGGTPVAAASHDGGFVGWAGRF